jgi:FKBP-type peptidyl-prolyl cis-trans isomerase FkpA
MTEVTRVPIQPIAKGSLTKLWLGVAVAILLGAGLAWAAMPKGLDLDTQVAGTGATPKVGDVVFVKYKGSLAAMATCLTNRANPAPGGRDFPRRQPVPDRGRGDHSGLLQGPSADAEGRQVQALIPADQAYGAEPPQGAPIPPNADLVFEIEVIDIMSRADL